MAIVESAPNSFKAPAVHDRSRTRWVVLLALTFTACSLTPTDTPGSPTANPATPTTVPTAPSRSSSPACVAASPTGTSAPSSTVPGSVDGGPPVDISALQGRIAFVYASAIEECYAIVVISLGAPGPLQSQRLTPYELDESYVSPSWSPDGTRIAYQHGGFSVGGRPGAYVMNADGTDPQLIATDAATPVWSPDGTELAISNLESSHRGVAIIELTEAGNPRHDVTTVPDSVPEEYPAWSPDGQRLAFNSHRAGPNNSDIWVVDRDGTHLVNLTPDHSGLDNDPDWSPDGSRIAFSSERTGGDVYLMDPDGSHLEQLTSAPGYDGGPIWSPDGRFLLFASRRIGSLGIWVMRPDGTGQTLLFDSPDEELMMSWTP